MKKEISRRHFCKNASLATMGLALGAACSDRVVGPDTRGLKAPENLTGKGLDSSSELTWSASPDPQFSHFNVYRGSKTNRIAQVEDPAFAETGLINDTVYTYYVTIVDSNGIESDAATVVITPTLASSLLVKVTASGATSGLSVDYATVKNMIFEGVKKLTGLTDTGQAFESLFPSLTAASKIGIKVNTLTGLKTHPEVAFAVAEGLLLMSGGTFPAGNITVFDYDKPANGVMAAAGFTSPESFSPSLAGIQIVGELVNDFSSVTAPITQTTQRLSGVLVDSDYIINIPVLKDHLNAGMTFSLKNFYGCIDSPELMHDDNGNQYCNPAIPQLNSRPEIKDKLKLIVGDCLYIVPSGGPQSNVITNILNTILLCQDPVTIDFYALGLINAERLLRGYSMVSTTDVVDNHNPASYLETASRAPYALGNKNEKLEEVVL